MSYRALAGKEEPVIEDQSAIPVRDIFKQEILISGLQHEIAVADIFRLDCRFICHGTLDDLSQQVPRPFDTCRGMDIACHPLHSACLCDHACFPVHAGKGLFLAHTHLRHEEFCLRGQRRHGKVPLMLHNGEHAFHIRDQMVRVIE